MTKIVWTRFPITYISRPNSIITTMKYPTSVKRMQAGIERPTNVTAERHAIARPTELVPYMRFD